MSGRYWRTDRIFEEMKISDWQELKEIYKEREKKWKEYQEKKWKALKEREAVLID